MATTRTTIHVFPGTADRDDWGNTAWDQLHPATAVETVPANVNSWDECEVGHGSRIGIALSVPAAEVTFAVTELESCGFEVEVQS